VSTLLAAFAAGGAHGSGISCAVGSGRDLHGRDLQRRSWPGRDLRCADLRGANLEYVDLTGANLARADLERPICSVRSSWTRPSKARG
jgi:uncharacterized protein YjbI with pentapeptide repeats